MWYIFGIPRFFRLLFRLARILLVAAVELAVFYVGRPSQSVVGRRLRHKLEKLGPTFVKFGQIMSTRTDILPPEIIAELEKLQSNVAPFAWAAAKRTIERNLKKPLPKLFSEFEQKTVAAASLGQVYRAKLHSGETVAVKVQRPKAKRMITTDVSVLLSVARLAVKLFPALVPYNLEGAVKEFRRWSLNELNYTLEAANADIFNQHFKDDPHIYSPKVYWDYTAKQVLTLEFIRGQSLKDIIQSEGDIKRKKLIVRYGSDSFVRQYFEFGFFHADPHPSNILVSRDNVLYFLDFGMVGRLDSKLTELVAGIFLGLMQKDEEKIVQLLTQIHEDYANERALQPKNAQINGFRKAAGEIIDQWFGVTAPGHSLTRLFYNLLQAAVSNGFFVPVDVIMLAKSIVTLDIVTKALDPSFDLAHLEEPLIRKLVMKRLDPERLLRQAQEAALVADKMIAALPALARGLTRALARGQLGAEANPEQLAEYEARLEQAVSNRGLATVTAALFIGFALMANLENGPAIFNLPLSLIVLAFGFVLLLKLLINLQKGDRAL